MSLWAIIPVKPLSDSKSRLAGILSPEQRAALTTRMLNRTLGILLEVPAVERTLVVSRDPLALKIARQYGASTYGETEKQDLNMALTRATYIAMARHAGSVLIVPADLPFVTREDVEMMVDGVAADVWRANGSGHFLQHRAMAICPDHNREGTNALLLSPPTGFVFHYGPGSFERHLQEGERLGLSRRIVHAPGIKFDLDTEADWATYRALEPEPAAG